MIFSLMKDKIKLAFLLVLFSYETINGVPKYFVFSDSGKFMIM